MGPEGPIGQPGPIGPKGDRGPKGEKGPKGPVGSSIISFFPFASNSGGFTSTTYSDGNPAQVGLVSLGEVFTSDVSGGLSGTVTVPGHAQYGTTIPVNCILDTICLTVGSPAFKTTPSQTIHAFALLATADGDDQLFTLHPNTMAEVTFKEGSRIPARVRTARVTGLSFSLAAQTRCVIVCGHYTQGELGSTGYTFTYSGTVLFK